MPLTRTWRNQDDIRRQFLTTDVLSAARHDTWWATYLDRDDDFVFVIEECGELKRPVGQIALYDIDWSARTAAFGRLMVGDAAARGRGLAKEAAAMLVKEAFGPLGLSEINLEVRHDNDRAIAIYRDLGFREVSRHAGIVAMRLRTDDREQPR